MTTKVVNFKLTEELLHRIDDRSKRKAMNRTEYIISLIQVDLGDCAPAVAYWLDLQAIQSAGLVRNGEIEWHELTCPACEQPIDKPMIPVMGNGEHGAAHCSSCGFSDG